MNRAASERLPSTRPDSASAAASATGAPNAGASDARASGASDAPAPDASASDASASDASAPDARTRTGVVKTLALACRRAWIRTGATGKCKTRGAGGEQTEIFDYSFHIILSIWFLGCGARTAIAFQFSAVPAARLQGSERWVADLFLSRR